MSCLGQIHRGSDKEQRPVQISCKHFSEMAFCEFCEGGLDPCSQLHHFFYLFTVGALYVYLCTFVFSLSRWTCHLGWQYLNCLICMSLWRTLKRMLCYLVLATTSSSADKPKPVLEHFQPSLNQQISTSLIKQFIIFPFYVAIVTAFWSLA